MLVGINFCLSVLQSGNNISWRKNDVYFKYYVASFLNGIFSLCVHKSKNTARVAAILISISMCFTIYFIELMTSWIVPVTHEKPLAFFKEHAEKKGIYFDDRPKLDVYFDLVESGIAAAPSAHPSG
tara:strand:- start:310 stop:687 length:378 start_codon:yes stop_codon:yes gene_type:complete